MKKLSLVLLGLLASACAHSEEQRSAPKPEPCRIDPRLGGRCAESPEELSMESRERVIQAELGKRTEIFRARLDRLRAEQEAKTTTTGPDIEEVELAEFQPQTPTVDLGPLTSGSSARALTAAPSSVKQKPAEPEIPHTVWLQAARCILRADEAHFESNIESGKLAGPREIQAQAGTWAEVKRLREEVLTKLRPENLAKRAPPCTSSDISPLVGLMRTLVGAAPDAGQPLGRYQRGLARLRGELQKRTNLVFSQ